MVIAAKHSNEFRNTRLICGESVLEISSAEFTAIYGEFLREMKLPEESINSEMKVHKKMQKDMTEAGARMDKYHDKSKIDKPFTFKRYKDRRCVLFHIDSVRDYIKNDLQRQDEEDDGGVEETKMEPIASAPTKRILRAQRNSSDHSPAYVVKERGETVFSHDDLEEINKYMGEAYIKTGEDGSWILINPLTKAAIVLDDEYKGEHGKTKLEMKYPWYRKSRII